MFQFKNKYNTKIINVWIQSEHFQGNLHYEITEEVVKYTIPIDFINITR